MVPFLERFYKMAGQGARRVELCAAPGVQPRRSARRARGHEVIE